MELGQTERKLEAITDEGVFEKLAAAVLRQANPLYRSLAHPGVNADGKTVKSPVDGIMFVPGAQPAHMVIVHHTTTERDDLEKKWLHDPATVKSRGPRPTAPPGDLIKAIKVTREQRLSEPNLVATLILTTNREPDEEPIRLVHAEASKEDIAVEFWTRSALAHTLDTDADGQWIRYQYLGSEPQRLSLALLQKLSKASLMAFPLQDEPKLWVDRALDQRLKDISHRGVTFVVASSGLGKSTACYKWLANHVGTNGIGLVLSHSVIAASLTLDGAVEASLKELDPHLAPGAGSDAFALATADTPLLLVIEDINRSGQAAVLAEKLLSWDRRRDREPESGSRNSILLCPLWPDVLGSLTDRSRVALIEKAVLGGAFTEGEGRTAVQQRAREVGVVISEIDAEALSSALGHDPLLIALHDPSKKTASASVIGDFVESRLVELANNRQDHPATKYRLALRAYAASALKRRSLDAAWSDIEHWTDINDTDRILLGQLTQVGTVIRLAGPLAEQRIAYRHDRVRDWLLVDAATDLVRAGSMPDDVLGDPYYAEIIAGTVTTIEPDDQYIANVRDKNPLALFHSLRFLHSKSATYGKVVTALKEWLADPASIGPATSSLRWGASQALLLSEVPDGAELARGLREKSWVNMLARFRNGDVGGGIELCASIEPGSSARWRDVQIDHAKHRFGAALNSKIIEFLGNMQLDKHARTGLIRLAGHMASPLLGPALEASWNADADRGEHLADYLWAFAQCCGDEPERYLQSVCDAWAALPEERNNNMPSPKDDLAAHNVRWAFRHWPPKTALPYFIKRAEQADLRWQITYMLTEIDDPVTIIFIVQEAAAIDRRVEQTQGFSPFTSMLPDGWRRLQEDGQPMSDTSRSALLSLWLDPGTDKHTRKVAFRIWCATEKEADLILLQHEESPAELRDDILCERLKRGDHSAIPQLLSHLNSEERKADWWWWFVKYVWCDELMPILDTELAKRSKAIEPKWQHGHDSDYQTSDLLMRMSPSDAEALLRKYWGSLCYISNFIHAALHVATPIARELVKSAVLKCGDPELLFKYIGQHIGLKTKGHPGITRREQIVALSPYLDYFAKHEVLDLCEICNQHGWFDLRQSLLEPQLRKNGGVVYGDETPTFAALDDFVAKNHVFWVDHWLDDYAKAGVPHDTRIALLEKWLKDRRTVAAKRLIFEAVAHFGRRTDLHLLDFPVPEEGASLDALKTNTIFAVRRRSLV